MKFRLDYLHFALISILVLLVIFCFRTIREGAEPDTADVHYITATGPSGYCYQSTVTGPVDLMNKLKKATKNQLPGGIKNGPCPSEYNVQPTGIKKKQPNFSYALNDMIGLINTDKQSLKASKQQLYMK